MGTNFQDLEVWKRAINFYINLSPLLRGFPAYERNNLTSQIARASLSISNNIAEGYGRFSDKNLKYFLKISFGSSKEV